ncbi:hypothetical protein [Streptomyces sp. bgisy154]|uniref:hypothetical protein n=1 Tax=Streptomyces sp. bgisy154 TaxID=3413794 RepID=UPI003D71EEC1
MGIFRRTQSSRTYPAAGRTITGPARRFFTSKTTGARQAGRDAQAWEDQDRAAEHARRGPYRP